MQQTTEEPIYSKCSNCGGRGTISQFPSSKRTQIIILAALFFIGFALFMVGGTQLLQFKLGPDNPPINAKAPGALLVLIGALLMGIFGGAAYFLLNIVRQLRAWFFLECPNCEEGYLKTHEVGYLKSFLFFLDQFLFHEILIPMYHAITFRKFWLAENRQQKFLFLLKMIFYLFIFFGSIPFLIFLLGTKQSLGLLFSCGVMLYLLTLIFSANEEDTHQRGVIFLMIPLYYVSMVEIFRWAWIVSSHSFVPDVSDFLFLGLENLIRTQIFVDFFEVYDLPIADIGETSFLAHTAIFFTRLLLDAAIITMLIRAFIYSFRRSWIYKHTGLTVAGLPDPDALSNLENLAITRHPRKINEVLGNLKEVFKVLGDTQKYVNTVADQVKTSGTTMLQKEIYECKQMISGVQFTPEEEEDKLEVSVLDRILATLIMAGWCIAFLFGLQYFIEDLTKREIAFLMEEAAKVEYQNEPFKRIFLYTRVLKKDAQHEQGLLKSAETMLDIADRRVDLLSLEQGERDIDNFFNRVLTLEKITGLNSPHQEKLREMAARAYVARGKIFFLRNDLPRAMAELNKENSDDLRRLRYGVTFYEACEKIPLKTARKEDFQQALSLLGEVKDFSPQHLVDLGIALTAASQGNFLAANANIERFLNNDKAKCSFAFKTQLRKIFADGVLFQNQPAKAMALYEELIQQNISSAYLGKANALRLQKQTKQAKAVLTEALTKTKGFDKAQIQLALGIIALAANTSESVTTALTYFQNVWESYPIHKSLQLNFTYLLQKKISLAEFEKRILLWQVKEEDVEKSLGYFYLGVYALSQKEQGAAGLYFQKCLGALEERAEGTLARQELALLQILFEKQSLETRLLFHPQLLKELSTSLKDEVITGILPPTKVLESLKWAMDSSNDEMKAESLFSVSQAKIIAAKDLIPLLIQGLQSESLSVKKAALDGLVFVGEESAKAKEDVFKVLDLKVGNEDSEEQKDLVQGVKRAAVKVMKSFGESSVSALTKALKDSDKYIRRDAGYAFANLKEKALPAKKVLVEKLQDPEIIVRDAAFEAIAALGKESVPLLIDIVVKSEHSSLGIQAIRVLQKQYPKSYQEERKKIIPFFVKALTTDKDPETQRYAAQQLIKLEVGPDLIQKSEVVAMLKTKLTELLNTSDPLKKVAGALSLLSFGTRFNEEVGEAKKFLITYLQQLPLEKQKELLAALSGKEYRKQSLSILISALKSKNPGLRKIATLILKGFREEGDAFANEVSDLLNEICTLFPESEEVEELYDVGLEQLSLFFNETGPFVFPHMFSLLHHPDEIVRGAVLEAWNSDFEMTPTLEKSIVKGLNSSDNGIKITHFQLLLDIEVEDESVLPLMKESVQSDEPSIVAAALKVLSSTPDEVDEALVQTAEKILASEDEEFDEAKENAILLLGSVKGVDYIAKTFKNKNATLKAFAATALGGLVDTLEDDEQLEKIGPVLMTFLKDPDPEVAAAAISAFIFNGVEEDSLIDELNKLVKGKNEDLAEEAQIALVKLDPESHLDTLIEQLGSEDNEEIKETLDVLLGLDEFPQKVIEAMIPLTKHKSSKIRDLVKEGLDGTSLKLLSRLLKSSESSSVIFALESLGRKGKKAQKLAKRIRALCAEKNYQLPALKAWLKIGFDDKNPEDLKFLQDLTTSESVAVQIEIYFALALAGQPEATRKLVQLLEHPKTPANTSFLALEKLSKLSPQMALPVLTQALQLRFGKVSPIHAVQILARMGTKAETALPVLYHFENDSNPILRNEVEKAIAKIQ